jgi:plasmanylethanolamine desaturase
MVDAPRASDTDTPLIAAYSNRFRLVETSAIWIFAALLVALGTRVWTTPFAVSVAQVGWMAMLGALAADLVSGLVHWAADTWGDQTWPIVGPTLIRSFREHHVDEKAITRHDFIEANGATALVLLPLMFATHLSLPRNPSAWTAAQDNVAMFVLSLSFFVFMTNQIHKWSHLDQPPQIVGLLQTLRLILSADHHQEHHTGEHLSHYCITTGWLNPLLDRLQFFRMSEQFIQAISTLQPREDDLKLIGMTVSAAPEPALRSESNR